MHKFTTALLAALFGAASFAGTAYSQALHPERAHSGLLASGPAIALADDDDNDDQGDRGERGRGNSNSCINPAGHQRGWCKHGNRNGRYNGNYGSNYSTISGTVIAVNGDLVQFRQDNGATMTINQRNLLNNGGGLNVGGHYTLRGYWNNNMFIAQANGGYYGGNNNGYPNNGYPYPGNGGNANASVQGVITAVNGNHVTIMQGLFQSITVDDQQALNNGSAQNLYVGRSVTAYGFWSGNTFYATSIG